MKSNKTLCHEIYSIVELPQDGDVITYFGRLEKACQNILWLCKHHQNS